MKHLHSIGVEEEKKIMKIIKRTSAKIFPLLMLGGVLSISSCKKEPHGAQSLKSNSPAISAVATYAPVTIGANAFYIESALPAGYVKDGTVNYTTYIQGALNKYSEVIFPAFPLQINDNGLIVKSNKVLTFLEGGKLVLKPTSNNNYRMLQIEDQTNVVLNNVVLVGDRTRHLGTGNRYGHGIAIYGSENIVINNPQIYDTWGDGIYVGRTDDHLSSKNVTIVGAFVMNPNRNGMSITAGEYIRVEKSYFGYAGLTGFDVEGNDSGPGETKNITLTDITTERSTYNGLTLALSRIYESRDKSLGEIKIVNHHDIGAKNYCFKFTIGLPDTTGMGTIAGVVNVVNPVWENPGSGRPNYNKVYPTLVKTNIYQPKVKINNAWLSTLSIQRLLKLNFRVGNIVLSF